MDLKTVTPTEVDAFLDDFALKADSFRRACEQYQHGEISIADITRHLSEATADAEFFFSEHSQLMGMEQLQRYGTIQALLDKLTVQVFEAEITHNQEVILQAIENGDYFIVNMTYNAIKSSIYMICSKQKIKTQQDKMLTQNQQELETAQTFIKVLKALESVIRTEPATPNDWPKIEKALAIYVDYFSHAEPMSLKQASDQRVFVLYAEHVNQLEKHQPPGWFEHFSSCKAQLLRLASSPEQHALLAAWEAQLAAAQGQAPLPAPAPSTDFSWEAGAWLQALNRHHDQLEALFSVEDFEKLNFPQIETSLHHFSASLEAAGGLYENSAIAHRIFTLFEGYVDFLSNADFAGEPLVAAEHIERCCKTLEGLTQTAYERQMLDAMRTLRNSISVLCPTPPTA
ncbi:MAG: hypothetical protein ACAI44_11830 [Candidatus Sericytochromatia bacterium]